VEGAADHVDASALMAVLKAGNKRKLTVLLDLGDIDRHSVIAILTSKAKAPNAQ